MYIHRAKCVKFLKYSKFKEQINVISATGVRVSFRIHSSFPVRESRPAAAAADLS